MPEAPERVELSIDTASAMAGVAVSRQGVVLVELAWRTENNHSAELLPAIDEVLDRAHSVREDVAVLFADRGPGSYAGLRVGISTAMGLALGLHADLLSAGRLELDAYPHAAFPGPIVAVHQAGRGELAWAVYEQREGLRELQPPRLSSLEELIELCPPSALLCGELAGIEQRLRDELTGARFATGVASQRRAGALAELGWHRYAGGERDNPVAVEPIYLREPAITQPKAGRRL